MSRAKKPRHSPGNGLHDRFAEFSRVTADAAGSVWASLLAVLTLLVWGISGPIFGFSDTWQLVINTGTTIVTFIMVFLIQSTQNRDAKAMHLKLDEVIRALRGARNDLIDLEEMPEEDLKSLAAEFASIHQREREVFKKRGHDLTEPDEDAKPNDGKKRRSR